MLNNGSLLSLDKTVNSSFTVSSLTFTGLVTGGPTEGERVVLKVAPPGLEPVRNRDVARQARLMRALAGAPGVRVPTVYFEDDGAPLPEPSADARARIVVPETPVPPTTYHPTGCR